MKYVWFVEIGCTEYGDGFTWESLDAYDRKEDAFDRATREMRRDLDNQESGKYAYRVIPGKMI